MSAEVVRLGALCPPVALSVLDEMQASLRVRHAGAEVLLEPEGQMLVVLARLRPAQAVPVGLPADAPVQAVLAAVAEAFGVDAQDLVGRARRKDLAGPRAAAMALCRELTDLSLPAIGRVFAGRDHTTVLHALASSARRCVACPDYARTLEAARARYRDASSSLPGLAEVHRLRAVGGAR